MTSVTLSRDHPYERIHVPQASVPHRTAPTLLLTTLPRRQRLDHPHDRITATVPAPRPPCAVR